MARGGASNKGGGLFNRVERENNETYHEVLDSGLGALFCLACETHGRFNSVSTTLIENLAREETRGIHYRVRTRLKLSLIKCWMSFSTMSLQKAVAIAIVHGVGVDLPTTLLEPVAALSDLQYN